MKHASPLRYPGGKSAMAGLLRLIRRINNLGNLTIAEPFAGGAGASLGLLYLEETPQIYINDLDPAVRDFWWAVVNRPQEFCKRIRNINVNMAEWRRQRAIYRNGGRVDRLTRGFAAFYLNRSNRSGIMMNGGPVGGVKQDGKWKLDARFNKPELVRRCQRVAEYRDRISVSGLDGMQFIDSLDADTTMFFIDPPYFHKGKTLYMNGLAETYHVALAEKLRGMKDRAWIATYDDCPEIRKLFAGWATIKPFSLRYVASDRRTGKEILIAPKWLRLPKTQLSLAIGW